MMSTTTSRPASWPPRIAGLVVSLFLALFALDAFDGTPLPQAVVAFVIHLIPSFAVLAVVAAAWRLPLIGAVVFPGLALVYAVWAHWRIDWVAAIGGPLLLVGVLYFVSWRANARRR